MKMIFISFLFGFINYTANSQKIEVINNITENKIEIQLYRGIIEIESCKCESIKLVQYTYDYDIYIKNKTLDLIEDNRFGLEINRNNKIIKVHNEQSRNIQKLILTIPEKIDVQIIIDHYGEVYFEEKSPELDIQIFQGIIKGNTSHAISASIVRDGSILINLIEDSFQLAFLSVYRGSISLGIQEDISSDFDIQMDLGNFENLTKAYLDIKTEYGGSLKENGISKNYNTKYYKGSINKKNKNLITIKSSKGDIILKNIK